LSSICRYDAEIYSRQSDLKATPPEVFTESYRVEGCVPLIPAMQKQSLITSTVEIQLSIVCRPLCESSHLQLEQQQVLIQKKSRGPAMVSGPQIKLNKPTLSWGEGRTFEEQFYLKIQFQPVQRKCEQLISEENSSGRNKESFLKLLLGFGDI
jgi:hypothetical protein